MVDVPANIKIAILAITEKGMRTAEQLQASLPGSDIVTGEDGIRIRIEAAWEQYDCLICIMAAGIVVRSLTSLCRSKLSDPAVVVMDEQGRYAISLLSGHIGGANAIVQMLEKKYGAIPVITTASDVSGHTSIDLWALENGLLLANSKALAPTALKLLNQGTVTIYQDDAYCPDMPPDLKLTDQLKKADIVISIKKQDDPGRLHLVPQVLYIGLGCRRGASAEAFQHALDDLAARCGIHLGAIAGAASIDLKEDEQGLLQIAERYKWPLRFFTKEQINDLNPGRKDPHVFNKVGAHGVCEPAAILAATRGRKLGRLLIGKMKWEKITAAIAIAASSMSLERDQAHSSTSHPRLKKP